MRTVLTTIHACLFVVMLCGCVQVSETQLNAAVGQQNESASDVQIYASFAEVPGSYELIAAYKIDDPWVNHKNERLAPKLQQMAAKAGANALVFPPLNEPDRSAQFKDAVRDLAEIPSPDDKVQDPGKQDAYGYAIAILVH